MLHQKEEDYFDDFFLLMLLMSAACCLISFILFLAVLESSPGAWMIALELVPDKAPDFIFEDEEEREERLSTGGLRPSVLAGDGLCLLELLPELPLDPDPDLALSLSGFLSSLTLELELGGLLPARLFPLFEHLEQFQMSLGSLASSLDTGGM